MVTETGWLIEDDKEPQWLTLKPAEALWSMVFTKDSNDAIRFCRRQDAEDYVSCHLDDAPVRITEHQWSGITRKDGSSQKDSRSPSQ
jgi:hypothetical protein